jgi:hypothetical protein
MNSKFMTATTTGRPSTVPAATSSASGTFSLAWASLSRSTYFFWSRKRSGSTGAFGTSTRAQVSSSSRARKRCSGPMRMWWLQWGQTRWFCSRSRWKIIRSHSGQACQRFSGTSGLLSRV